MPKNLILFITLVYLFPGCTNSSRPKNPVPHVASKVNPGTQSQIEVLLTDSAKLVKHLDSLLIPKFPINTRNANFGTEQIDLSAFKSKKLFGLHLKLREREIGGSIIDGEDMSSTFDLTDTTYKADWGLIARRPTFFAIIVDRTLVTLTYNLEIIDAMHIVAADLAGNTHFHGDLTTTIYDNLKLELSYYYEVQIDEAGNFDHQIEDDLWIIDKGGHFKFRKTRVIQNT